MLGFKKELIIDLHLSNTTLSKYSLNKSENLGGILVTQNKVLFQDEGGGGPRLSELPPFTQLTTICQFTSPAWPHMSCLERIPLGHRVLALIQAPYRAPEDASPATQSFYIKYEPKTRDHQLYEENQVCSFWIKLKKKNLKKEIQLRKQGGTLKSSYPEGLPGGLVVKNPPARQETGVWSLIGEDLTCHRQQNPRITTTEPAL